MCPARITPHTEERCEVKTALRLTHSPGSWVVWEGADGGLVRRRVVGISLGTWELSQLGVGRGPSGLRRQNPPLACNKVPLTMSTEEEEPWPFWLKVCSFCSHPAHPGCSTLGPPTQEGSCPVGSSYPAGQRRGCLKLCFQHRLGILYYQADFEFPFL